MTRPPLAPPAGLFSLPSLASLALLALVALVALTGCALVVPKAWRVGAPVPLHGPVHGNDAVVDLTDVPTEELARTVADGHRRLIEIAAETDSEMVAEQRVLEVREMALRLPALQRELEARGGNETQAHPRHPTIR